VASLERRKSNTKKQVAHRARQQASAILVADYWGAAPGRHKPVSGLHEAPAAQSTGPAQGNAHFWNCTLQRASPHDASLVHGNANGPGVAIAPAGAAPGTAPAGAGVAAVTAGWGRGWAAVGAGGVYGAGATGGGSLSLAQALTIENTPARAIKDFRSIEFVFPRRIGRMSKRLRNRARPLAS
jgi:hypothetical protein